MIKNKQEIACPHCGKSDTWHSENIYRPFCSSRCKLIDLGEWASEKKAIAGEPVDTNPLDDEEYPQSYDH